MVANCSYCSAKVVRGQFNIACYDCRIVCHVDCANLSKEVYKEVKLGNVRWSCSGCKQSAQSSADAVVDVNSIDLNREMSTLRNELKVIKETAKQMMISIDFLSERVDAITKLQKTVDVHEKRIKHIEAVNDELRGSLRKLEIMLDDRDQTNRSANVQISNIPIVTNENLMKIWESLLRKLGLEPSSVTVNNIHRVQAADPTKIKPIIVYLGNPTSVQQILKAARTVRPKCGDVGLPGDAAIYINEHLTVVRKALFYKAKLFRDDKGYKYLWTRNGKIFLKKSDNSKAILINMYTDFDKLK